LAVGLRTQRCITTRITATRAAATVIIAAAERETRKGKTNRRPAPKKGASNGPTSVGRLTILLGGNLAMHIVRLCTSPAALRPIAPARLPRPGGMSSMAAGIEPFARYLIFPYFIRVPLREAGGVTCFPVFYRTVTMFAVYRLKTKEGRSY